MKRLLWQLRKPAIPRLNNVLGDQDGQSNGTSVFAATYILEDTLRIMELYTTGDCVRLGQCQCYLAALR
jgi:hypothetical protein